MNFISLDSILDCQVSSLKSAIYIIFIIVYFRLSKYLVSNEKENEDRHIERFGQFDVAYHNISFDNDEESKDYELNCMSDVL